MSKTLSRQLVSDNHEYQLREDHNLHKIEVLLADDNREFTNLLSEYISEQSDMSVSGVAYNGEEVIETSGGNKKSS